MKKRILSLLLIGSILISCNFNVAAAEIIVEESSDTDIAETSADVITEEQLTDIIVEEDTPDSASNMPRKAAPYVTESNDENVGTSSIYDSEIEWSRDKTDPYWNTIIWSDVQWNSLSGMTDPNVLTSGWSEKVDWSEVDWDSVNWNSAYSSKDNSRWNAWKKWSEIKWEQVNWGNMVWGNVDWNAIKDLSNTGKINITFEYNGLNTNNQLVTPVIDNADLGEDTIISSCVTIKINSGNPPPLNNAVTVPKESYIITVKQDGDIYRLHGLHNSTASLCSNKTYFDDLLNLPEILNQNVKYPLTQDDYWIITINDEDCTFADSYTPLPDITITSKDGKVTLDKDTDYTVSAQGIFSCGEYEVEIEAMATSKKVGAGTVKKSFTVHYADINKYYTLKGLPSKITVQDYIPTLTSGNGSSVPFSWIDGHLYLEPQNSASLENGRLPSITSDSKYKPELWDSKGFLKVAYRYDDGSSGEPKWLDTLDMDTWLKNHRSSTIHIRVSVNEDGGEYYPTKGDLIPRFIKGSIYSSVQVKPYSLENPDPTLTNFWCIAAVNPNPVKFSESDKKPDWMYADMKEDPVSPVVYNGSEHKPNINVSVFFYNLNDLYEYIYYKDWETRTTKKLTYIDNINAGTGKVLISFDGDFTGTITRSFTILPKDITDSTNSGVNIQAQDFLYDGNPHAPILSITDDQAQTVLVEGKDYTVKAAGNTTSPGTVTATVTGKGNYQGTRTIQYKIVPTSTIVVGTKLEQVANIPEKIDDQKYTGQPITPEVVITGKNSGIKLVKDKDYTVTYLNNIETGKAYAVVKGIGSYGGTYIIPFNITERENQKIVVLPAQERDLKKRTLNSKPTIVKYTVAPKTSTTYASSDPNVVKVDSKTGAIEYTGIGTATITINAAASDVYNAAVKKLTVKVLPQTPKGIQVRFVPGKGITVTGKAVPESSHYQLRIKKGTYKSVFVNSENTGNLYMEYLTKSKGKFSVWVRSYKVVNNKEHFSAWSQKYQVTVK